MSDLTRFPLCRDIKDGINTSRVVIEVSPLLDEKIEDIRQEFRKLLNSLMSRLSDPDSEDEELEGKDELCVELVKMCSASLSNSVTDLS